MKHPKEQVEATANAIKDHFIPKDSTETSFSFHFTIPPAHHYKVSYKKDNKGNWSLASYEVDGGSVG